PIFHSSRIFADFPDLTLPSVFFSFFPLPQDGLISLFPPLSFLSLSLPSLSLSPIFSLSLFLRPSFLSLSLFLLLARLLFSLFLSSPLLSSSPAGSFCFVRRPA